MGWAEHREELLRRFAEDQAARQALTDAGFVGELILSDNPRHADFMAMVGRLAEVDRRNREWFRDLVSRYGWPLSGDVGRDGASAAWFLAQHADGDPAFQRLCLELVQALPAGEVDAVRVAMLTDRVMLKEAGIQRYGTQWLGRDGDWVPQPLENPAEVDNLRRAVGLDTLEENLRRIVVSTGQPGRPPAPPASD